MSWFLYQQILSEEARLEAAQNNYDNTLRQLDSFDSVKSDFDDSVNLKNQISGMLIEPDGTLGLIEELENAAELSGVTLVTNIGDNPAKKSSPKIGQIKSANTNNNANKDVWLELNIEGSYANTLQFIRYLENAKRLVTVSTISMNQAQNYSPDKILENADESLGSLKTKILISNVF